MSLHEKMAADEKERLHSENIFDDAAFEMFFRKHFVPLCAFCQYKFGFDLDLARDTVHNGFVKLWETRQYLSPDLSVKAYMYRIVSNLSIDILKHRRVQLRKERFLAQKNLLNDADNGFENTDLKQLAADIDKAVSELPEQMRRVFQLCRFEGLKYAEVAAHLSISVKTVETQMSRALVKLRQKLADYLLVFFLLHYCITGF
jgi:RNA polymerase sigma-70 factor (ECF subfamily)